MNSNGRSRYLHYLERYNLPEISGALTGISFISPVILFPDVANDFIIHVKY